MRSIIWMSSMAAVLLLSGCGLEERVPVEMDRIEKSLPLGNASSLQADISLDIGSLEISAGQSSTLYSLDLEYDKASYQPDINYEQGSGQEGRLSLKLESIHKRGIRDERRNNRLLLNLSDSLPVSLRVNTGVGDARLSLSRLHLTRLELQSGVSDARISSYDPNPVVCDEIRLRSGVGNLNAVGLGYLNFRRFDFEGGVGGATLDFAGQLKQDADVQVQVGVGGVNVRMPRDMGVRVSAERHFLSGLQLDGFHKESTGGDYYSENYNRAKVRIYMVVKTGVGSFRITWI
jgi:hypothetical protein